MVTSQNSTDVPPQVPLTPAAGEHLHLLEFWHIIRMRLPLFIGIVVCMVVGTAIYTVVATPLYKSQGRLLIEPAQVNVTRLDGVYDSGQQTRDHRYRDNFLQTQVELMRSESLMSEVFTHFNYADEDEFRHALEPLKKFRELFEVTPARNTFIVNVAFEWRDASRAAETTNLLMELYVRQYRERLLGLSDRGIETLRQQLIEIEKTRQDSLRSLAAFKKEKQIIGLEDAQRLLVQRMSQLNEAFINARVAEVESQIVVDSIDTWLKSGGDPTELPEALVNDIIKAFKLEHLRAQATLIELRRKYGNSHATVATQEKVAGAAEQAIKDEIANSIAIARMTNERAKLRVSLLQRESRSLESETFRLDELSATYRILEDAYNASEEAYRLVITRINEINITQSTGALEAGGNIMIETPAAEPRLASFPRRKLMVAASCIFAVLLAGTLCFLLDYLDSTVKSKDEAEHVLGGVPALGFVPHLDDNNQEHDVASSRSALAEAFRTIRTSLGLSIAGRQERVFVVTSAEAGEGKTLSAFNLAVTSAQDNKRVLLMEGDMRKPRLRKLLRDVAPEKSNKGLSTVLIGTNKLADVVWQHPDLPSLHLAACGPVPPNPAELLGSAECKSLIDHALGSYDLVIIDSPPVMRVADAAILAGMGLPLVFVVRAFRTDRRHLAMAADQIRTVQGRIVGTIINNANAPRKQYGYYYGGRYYHYRAGYYADDAESD